MVLVFQLPLCACRAIGRVAVRYNCCRLRCVGSERAEPRIRLPRSIAILPAKRDPVRGSRRLLTLPLAAACPRAAAVLTASHSVLHRTFEVNQRLPVAAPGGVDCPACMPAFADRAVSLGFGLRLPVSPRPPAPALVFLARAHSARRCHECCNAGDRLG